MRSRATHGVLLLGLGLAACFDDPSIGDTDSAGETGSGSGDGDGDGDGDSGDGDGDGDSGDGDGDGDSGDGDGDSGDGDGDPGPCPDGPYAVDYADALMLETGANPQGSGIADVDGDGNLDVLATSRDDHELRVYLGSGDGSFPTPTITPLNDMSFPSLLRGGAIADGVYDVVITSYINNAPSLVRLRGDGSGGFYDEELMLNMSPRFVLGAVTGDATLDIVAIETNALRVYPANVGQESFVPPNPIDSPAPWLNADALGVGDLDADGDIDVAVAAFGALHIGLNDGTGQFAFSLELDFFGGPTDVGIGDLDGDEINDIVLTTFGGGSDAGHVFLGSGGGMFALDSVISAPSSPTGVAVADIDADGHDDVAMVGLATIAAYLSVGGGTFGPGQQVACGGNNPHQLAIGDLNSDCVGDVVTVTEAGLCLMLSNPP